MNESHPNKDLVSGVLSAIGILGAVVELFYRPFGVGPVSFVLVLIGLVMSSKHRRLSAVALAAVGLCFMIGASIAVWDSNPLY